MHIQCVQDSIESYVQRIVITNAVHACLTAVSLSYLHASTDVAQFILTNQKPATPLCGPSPSRYGFSRARYVYSLISAVGIFFLGAGVSVYHGVSTLMTAHTLQSLPLVRCVCVCVHVCVCACVRVCAGMHVCVVL